MTTSDNSRGSLFRRLAAIIAEDNPHIPEAAVLGSTRLSASVKARFDKELLERGLLEPGEKVPGDCVDEVLDNIAQ